MTNRFDYWFYKFLLGFVWGAYTITLLFDIFITDGFDLIGFLIGSSFLFFVTALLIFFDSLLKRMEVKGE